MVSLGLAPHVLRIYSVSFEEQIMSKYECPNQFLRQMEAVQFIILQILFATLAVFKSREYHPVTKSYEVFRPVAPERKYFIDYK